MGILQTISSWSMVYLHGSLLLLAMILSLVIVFYNLNIKMTQSQFAIIVGLKIIFSIQAFIVFVAQIEYIVHFEKYVKLGFIEGLYAAAIKVFTF